MHDEESLVRRAQHHDAEAFDLLYEAYFDRIYRYVAVRIGNRLEAEDLTQEVFLKALHSISAYRWKGIPFSAWLYRIARNQVIDHVRKKPKGTAVPLEEVQLADEEDTTRMAEQKNDIERVMAAARHLTEAQQETISLRFVSDLSIAEVAHIMGRSEGAIKALQHSALVALRRRLTLAEP